MLKDANAPVCIARMRNKKREKREQMDADSRCGEGTWGPTRERSLWISFAWILALALGCSRCTDLYLCYSY